MRNVPRFLRVWLTEPLLSSILIICMILGMTIFVLLTIHITYQLSWDKHIPNHENIWRVQMDHSLGYDYTSTGISQQVAGPLVARLPQIKDWFTVTVYDIKLMFTWNDNPIALGKVIYCSRNAPERLNFKMVYGTWADAFSQQNKSLLISRSKALEIFGDINPVGEELLLHLPGRTFPRYVVTGVFEDFPSNQHIQGDYITHYTENDLNTSSTVMEKPDEFHYSLDELYCILDEDTDPAILVQEADRIIEENLDKIPNLPENTKITFRVVPMDETHYEKTFVSYFDTFDKSKLVKYGVVAIAILMVLVTNSLILLMVRTLSRKKELVIRRSAGAASWDIFWLFTREHLSIYLLMALFTVLLLSIILPYLQTIIPSFCIENIDWSKVVAYSLYGMITAGAIIVLYPAAFARVILYRELSGSFWKFAMLVQLTIALVLLTSSILLIRQIHLIDTKDPGFDSTNVFSYHLAFLGDTPQEEIMEEVSRIPGVEAVSHGMIMPPDYLMKIFVRIHGTKSEGSYGNCGFNYIGGDFFDVYRIPLIEGRLWEGNDSTGVVVNQSFIKRFGYHGIKLGTEIELGQNLPNNIYFQGPIIGVVGDAYWEGFRKNIQPMVYYRDKQLETYFHFRVTPAIAQVTHKKIMDYFQQRSLTTVMAATEYNTDWEFVHQSDPERNFMKVVVGIAIIGMFFTFVGIFGLTAYTLRRQMKNLAIRRVLGASQRDTLIYLLNNYLIISGIAFGISIPVSYYVLQRWLEGFSSRVSLTVFDYLFGLASICLLIFTGVLIHWRRLHQKRLIEYLRSE